MWVTIAELIFLLCSLRSLLTGRALGLLQWISASCTRNVFLIKDLPKVPTTTWQCGLLSFTLNALYPWGIICWHPTSVVHFWTLIPVVCPLGDQAYSKAHYKIFKKIGTLLFFHWHFTPLLPPPPFDFNLLLFSLCFPFHYFTSFFLSPMHATQPGPCAFKLIKLTEFKPFFKTKRLCPSIILIENKIFKRSTLFSLARHVFSI